VHRMISSADIDAALVRIKQGVGKTG